MNAKHATTAAPAQPGAAAGESLAQVQTQLFQAWQRQMDVGLRAMDAMLQGAGRLRDAQIPALSESTARFVTLQKELLAAKSPWEFWNCQCCWMIENATRALAAWKDAVDAAASLTAGAREAAERPLGEASVHAPAAAPPDLVGTALIGFDAAYGEMLKGSQQMMAAATEALNAGLAAWSPAAGKRAQA